MTTGSLLATIVSAVAVAITVSSLLGVIVGYFLGVSIKLGKEAAQNDRPD